MPLTNLGPLHERDGYRQNLPMVLPAIDERGNFVGEVRIETYRQFYDFIETNKDIALRHFQVLHGEVEPDRARGEYDPLA